MGSTHDDPVWDFLKECREQDPLGYALLAARYPIMSGQRIKRLRWRERTVGLLGLQECNLPLDVNFRHGFDHPLADEGDDECH